MCWESWCSCPQPWWLLLLGYWKRMYSKLFAQEWVTRVSEMSQSYFLPSVGALWYECSTPFHAPIISLPAQTTVVWSGLILWAIFSIFRPWSCLRPDWEAGEFGSLVRPLATLLCSKKAGFLESWRLGSLYICQFSHLKKSKGIERKISSCIPHSTMWRLYITLLKLPCKQWATIN